MEQTARTSLIFGQMHTLVMQAPVAICVLNGPDHVFSLVNEECQKFRPGQNMLGRTVANVFPELEKQGLLAVLDCVYERNISHMEGQRHVVLDSAGGPIDYYLDFVYQPSIDPITGEKCMLIFALNNTGSENSFRTLANSMPQMVWTTSPEGKASYFNSRWIDFFGDTGYGHDWESNLHPDDLPLTWERFRECFKTGQVFEVEHRVKDQQGNYRWFLARAVPVKNSAGDIIKWYGTSTDIQDQKVIEQELLQAKQAAEQANYFKSAFLANMSHEIRTPVAAITGFVELLKSEDLSVVERKRFMSIIQKSSQQLLALIDDILDHSKVEAGKLSLLPVDFSLVDFMNDLALVMRLRALEKGIVLNLQFSGEIPATINTDIVRLRQILSNVVGNAIKFTDRGAVDIELRYESPLLIFTVKDTGIGIPESQLDKIFRPFGQTEDSVTKYGGSGLGISLSKGLARMLGGDLILLETVYGVGSTFQLKIKPNMISKEGSGILSKVAVSALQEGVARKSKLRGLRVLLVEDSPENQILVTTYLRKSGAQVSLADDGVKGVDLALHNEYDIILMDIQMPYMDGYEAIQKLRGAGYRKPIVALTAHAMKEEKDRCFASGCTDYLAKPISGNLLIETLSRYLH